MTGPVTPETNREVNRVLALAAATLLLAGPRRTRPLAGFMLATWLSRAHAAGVRRLETTILDLFEQRKSVTGRVDMLAERFELVREGQRMNADQFDRQFAELAERVERLESQRLRAVGGGQA